MRKRLEKQGEFVATDDRGKQYRLTVFKEMFDSDDSDGEKVLDTRKVFMVTSDGQDVRGLGNRRYEIIATGVKLTASGPGAV